MSESIRGRGATGNPKNRFEPLEVVPDPGARDPGDPGPRTSRKARTLQMRMKFAESITSCVKRARK